MSLFISNEKEMKNVLNTNFHSKLRVSAKFQFNDLSDFSKPCNN